MSVLVRARPVPSVGYPVAANVPCAATVLPPEASDRLAHEKVPMNVVASACDTVTWHPPAVDENVRVPELACTKNVRWSETDVGSVPTKLVPLIANPAAPDVQLSANPPGGGA